MVGHATLELDELHKRAERRRRRRRRQEDMVRRKGKCQRWQDETAPEGKRRASEKARMADSSLGEEGMQLIIESKEKVSMTITEVHLLPRFS